MSADRPAPILVTGAPRSGNTWVARTISQSPRTLYIKEPFHVPHHLGVMAAPTPHWFTYVSEENQHQFRAAYARMLSARYSNSKQLPSVRSLRDAARLAYHNARFLRARALGLRPVVKDPIAVFSAEWLARTFAMNVVVMIRHPAAFAVSLTRIEGVHDLREILDQPLLMRDLLGEYEQELRRSSTLEQNAYYRCALLWKLITAAIAEYRVRHPEWVFLRHEDVSRNPLDQFSNVFDRLDVALTPKARAYILDATRPGNPRDAPTGVTHALKRDSLANIDAWRSKLSVEEVARIREIVEPVSSLFYSDSDW